jgi:CBS domain-containing protein
MNVADIMTREVLFVTPETPVNQVARALVKYNISGVPVVENGRVIGIVTEEDLVMRHAIVELPGFFEAFDSVFYLSKQDDFDKEVRQGLAGCARDLMTGRVVTISQNAGVRELAHLVVKKDVNPVPVVGDNGELVGIVSRSDLVRLMADLTAESEKQTEGATA